MYEAKLSLKNYFNLFQVLVIYYLINKRAKRESTSVDKFNGLFVD